MTNLANKELSSRLLKALALPECSGSDPKSTNVEPATTPMDTAEPTNKITRAHLGGNKNPSEAALEGDTATKDPATMNSSEEASKNPSEDALEGTAATPFEGRTVAQNTLEVPLEGGTITRDPLKAPFESERVNDYQQAYPRGSSFEGETAAPETIDQTPPGLTNHKAVTALTPPGSTIHNTGGHASSSRQLTTLSNDLYSHQSWGSTFTGFQVGPESQRSSYKRTQMPASRVQQERSLPLFSPTASPLSSVIESANSLVDEEFHDPSFTPFRTPASVIRRSASLPTHTHDLSLGLDALHVSLSVTKTTLRLTVTKATLLLYENT